jgi:predicted AlkP superfamily pyrophosphatase or phosphodiesterase
MNAIGSVAVLASATAGVVLVLTAPTTFGTAQSRTSSDPPRLLVTIVVDQMRRDYLDRYGPLAERGLKRLLTQGAVFDRAAYPYATTVTCAGHATIATGTFPATHGIIANEWWSREAGRRIPCTDDGAATSVPYVGPPEKIGHSARRLRVPTLSDRLRAAHRDARIVTLSMKARSAIMLAGSSGVATWFVDETNGWATSTAFAPERVPQIEAFLTANPMDRDREQIWSPLNPSAFKGTDDAAGERPKRGWTAAFPHPLAGASGTPDWQYLELWKCSPYADDYLGALAGALVRSLELGRRGTIDVLGVSFSGLDCIGHDFGPDSAEVQDAVLRLDRTLGTLFDTLDSAVGANRYVVALSADHGVSPIPEQVRAQGGDAGRVLAPVVRKVAEAAMQAAHGPGPHVASVIPPYINFAPDTRARAQRDPETLRPVIDAVSKMNGVLRVLRGRDLESKRTSADPIERAAALSYHPDESGELVYLLKPHWLNGDASAASHGTVNVYDQTVPVIFLGASVKPGRYAGSASPADIAPTLATLIKLPLPHVEGKALTEALLISR